MPKLSPDPTPPGLLQTVDRALQVLLSLDRHRQEWGVTEVATEFGWDKSVAQRILATLAHRGLLISDPATRRYRIGPAILLLHRLWEQSGSLQLLVHDLMQGLSDRTGLTSVLAVPDIAHMRCVSSVEGRTGKIRYYPLVGELYPAHAGATSKAYFGFLAESDRRRILSGRPMAKFTDKTVTSESELEQQLAAIRSRGYAYTVGEYDRGVATLAVPVMLKGEPVASLSVAGSEADLPDDGKWLPLLQDIRDQVERRLGTPQRSPTPRRNGRR